MQSMQPGSNGGSGYGQYTNSGHVGMAPDTVTSIFNRLDAMTKTQTDLITYLHAGECQPPFPSAARYFKGKTGC